MSSNVNDVIKSLEGSNAKLGDLKPTHITADGVAVLALTGYAIVVRNIHQDLAAKESITVGGQHFTADSTIGDLLKAAGQGSGGHK